MWAPAPASTDSTGDTPPQPPQPRQGGKTKEEEGAGGEEEAAAGDTEVGDLENLSGSILENLSGSIFIITPNFLGPDAVSRIRDCLQLKSRRRPKPIANFLNITGRDQEKEGGNNQDKKEIEKCWFFFCYLGRRRRRSGRRMRAGEKKVEDADVLGGKREREREKLGSWRDHQFERRAGGGGGKRK